MGAPSKDSTSSFPFGSPFRRNSSGNRSSIQQRDLLLMERFRHNETKYDSKPINEQVEEVPSSFILSNERLISTDPCPDEILNAAKSLNRFMQQLSGRSSLVVTNLPDVPGDITAAGYMQFIEHLCAGLKRVML